MPTYLLTWNPNFWSWDDFEDDYKAVKEAGSVTSGWNIYRNFRQIQKGDRVFVLRQSVEPKGLVAAGYVTSKPWHNGTEWRIRTRLFELLRPNTEILPKAKLMHGNIKNVHWGVQFSGMKIKPEAAVEELEEVWRDHLESLGLETYHAPDELASQDSFWEGAIRRVVVNAYERDPRARAKCIAHHGASCTVCGFDFEKVFGDGVRGIHVHHLLPLSKIRKRYMIDPVTDLRPVCPNCHAAIHSRSPALSIAKVRKLRKG